MGQKPRNAARPPKSERPPSAPLAPERRKELVLSFHDRHDPSGRRMCPVCSPQKET